MNKINFASDNYAGIHASVLDAIQAANAGPAIAYGDDAYTENTIDLFQQLFGGDINVYLVMNGTGANVTGLSTMLRPYEAIICAEKAHIQVDECGAPEKLTGSKLLLVPAPNGKITTNDIQRQIQRIGDQHHVQAKVISISQSTEYGTVYTLNEVSEIAAFAHSHDMYLHMDGARIANAAASLNIPIKAFTKEAGVDVLSFGGTKNGMMLGEAVIFFNKQLADSYKFIRKQYMQLASKMRFISAQFHGLLNDNVWLDNARHANAMAKRLEAGLRSVSTINITQSVDANVVFAIFPENLVEEMQKQFYFYVWDEATTEVRLMTSFNTTTEEVDAFIAHLKQNI